MFCIRILERGNGRPQGLNLLWKTQSTEDNWRMLKPQLRLALIIAVFELSKSDLIFTVDRINLYWNVEVMFLTWQPWLFAVHERVYNMVNGDETSMSVIAGSDLVLMVQFSCFLSESL